MFTLTAAVGFWEELLDIIVEGLLDQETVPVAGVLLFNWTLLWLPQKVLSAPASIEIEFKIMLVEMLSLHPFISVTIYLIK